MAHKKEIPGAAAIGEHAVERPGVFDLLQRFLARYSSGMSLPAKLQRIVDLFAAAPKDIKVQALLDYSNRVPDLPARFADHPELLERVHECQSPFFLAAEVNPDETVTIYFDSPREAPTTRGYAGILTEGLAGATASEVLAVPDDFYTAMGLHEVVSPLRLRGMGAILARTKRQVRESLSSGG